MNVGKKLKEIRESKNISIYRLSQESQISESHIRNLERGIKRATVETLEMLVTHLNMTMSEFFNEDDAISYLTPKEKVLLKYFRTLSNETADIVIESCEKLYSQSNCGK